MRLTSPVATSFVNTDKISFERAKTGVWGFRSDKNETVNGHDCKVFNPPNAEIALPVKARNIRLWECASKFHPLYRNELYLYCFRSSMPLMCSL